MKRKLLARVVAEVLESRKLLCAEHTPIGEAPQWDPEIEAASQVARGGPEGGPEAIDIVWTNRNTFSGAGDNFFDEVFGTSAAQAQGVIDAAIVAWENVITSFNRADGTSTLQVSITMNSGTAGFGGAGGPAQTAPADGKPRTGSITIDAGNLSAPPNDNNGWFLDPTPNDYSEFQGTILTPFSGAQTPTGVGGELFSVITSEITHVLGLISPKAGGAGANWNGYRLISSGLVQNTGVPGIRDNAEGGGTSGFFYTFNGFSLNHLMTSFNSGDPDSDSWGNVIHTAGGTANITHNAVNYRGTEDDGNAAGGGERTLPSWVTANILKDAYGYTIENPAKFGTMMTVFNQSTGALNIRGLDNSDDIISLTSGGGKLFVSVDLGNDFPGSGFRPGVGNLDAYVSEFNLAGITSINISTGTGTNSVFLDNYGNIPTTVVGHNGNDQIVVVGTTGNDQFGIDFPLISGPGTNVQSFSFIESVRFVTRTGNADFFMPDTDILNAVTIQGDSGAETINLHTLDSGTPLVMFMGSGNDTVNVQTDPGVGLIESPVTINGFDGDDIVNVGPVGFASTIVTQPITFNGDNNNDRLVLGSDNADSVAATMTFNGGAGTDDRVIYNDTAPSYNLDYDVRPTFVNRVGFNNENVNYTNTDRIVINAGLGADTVIVRNAVAPIVEAFGNGGNDNFTRGDGIITAASVANFDGGPGTDQITFDDHLSTGNMIFDCRQGEVFYGGLITQFTTGFESVGILAGTGQNEITFAQTLSQNFNVDAGGGNDTIIFGFQTTVLFNGTVSVNGGAGADSFQINGASTGGSASVTINGGNDLNSMTVNRPGTLVYDIGGGFLDLFSLGTDAHFITGNIETASIQGNSLAESFNIYSATSLFGLYQVFGNSGDDLFNVVQPDGSNFAFDNLQLNGGAGSDRFVYDAQAVTGNGVYTFANNVLSVSRGGIFSDDIQVGVAIETVTFNGGSGNDLVRVDQYSAGSALRINLGGGDDTLRYGNGNLSANLTNASLFSIDGQSGYDTAHVDNLNNTIGWQYTSNATSFVSATSFPNPAYSWTMTHANLDQIDVHAGVGADGLSIPTVPAGQRIDFFGNDGNDSMSYINNLLLIQGRVTFNGEGGNNQINNLVSNGTTGQVMHLTQDSIGAYPGDVYFGAGGAVFFSGVTSILLTMSNGPDSVYAQPNVGATVTIRGSNGDDTLNLAMAAAGNYSINPGQFGSFDVVSDNALTLNYSGFENGPNIDEVAPAVVVADINLDGLPPALSDGAGPRQSLDVEFSEDVSALLTPASLQLVNLTSGETIPSSSIVLEYDLVTNIAHFTFPGYDFGVLPDGNYTGTIFAGVPDFFGNALPADVTFDFFFLNGDATRDRTVGIADFSLLAANFNLPGTFSTGDFNYSGEVEIGDFSILASKFNTSLPEPPALARTGNLLTDSARSRFSTRLIEDILV